MGLCGKSIFGGKRKWKLGWVKHPFGWPAKEILLCSAATSSSSCSSLVYRSSSRKTTTCSQSARRLPVNTVRNSLLFLHNYLWQEKDSETGFSEVRGCFQQGRVRPAVILDLIALGLAVGLLITTFQLPIVTKWKMVIEGFPPLHFCSITCLYIW